MKDFQIEESGMVFTLDMNSAYLIEKSEKVSKLSNVKIVEFVQLSKKCIELVEAKTSAPNPENGENIQKFMADIREKFQNSISLLNAAAIKRRKEIFDELPELMQKYNWAKAEYQLYLIIKNHKIEWLPPMSELIKKRDKAIPYVLEYS